MVSYHTASNRTTCSELYNTINCNMILRQLLDVANLSCSSHSLLHSQLWPSSRPAHRRSSSWPHHHDLDFHSAGPRLKHSRALQAHVRRFRCPNMGNRANQRISFSDFAEGSSALGRLPAGAARSLRPLRPRDRHCQAGGV